MAGKIQSEYKYIFGPVPSRRLGLSLGVDLMPPKTCTLDCVYCECGKTTSLTLEKKEYTPVDEIINELTRFLADNPRIDHVTFSGFGEPTLHSGIGEIISFLKTGYPQYKIALLTNGTLLYQPDVSKNISGTDIAFVSLDAVSQKIFNTLNRPHPKLELSAMLEGISSFRDRYLNKLMIELFIVPGLNDKKEELEKIQKTLHVVRPDGIHLNTLDRPGTESWIKPASLKRLTEIEHLLKNTTMIRSVESRNIAPNCTVDRDKLILSTLMRRPCTVEDVSRILGIRKEMASRYLEKIAAQGKIEKKKMPRGIFYMRRN